MNCSTITRHLTDYAMDDVAASDRPALATHVRDCPACARRLDGERQVVSMLRDWSETEQDDADQNFLRLSVRHSIEADAQRSNRMGTIARVGIAASIAAVATLLGLAGLGRMGSPSDEAAAGPATKVEDAEPGVFTMVGPFSAKERVESRRNVEKPRRSEPRSRRVVRRMAAPTPSAPTPGIGVGTVDSDTMMRFEFQTADPKIRIIWFVPRADDEAESTPSDIGD